MMNPLNHSNDMPPDVALAIYRVLNFYIGDDFRELAPYPLERLSGWVHELSDRNAFVRDCPGIHDWFIRKMIDWRLSNATQSGPDSAKIL